MSHMHYHCHQLLNEAVEGCGQVGGATGQVEGELAKSKHISTTIAVVADHRNVLHTDSKGSTVLTLMRGGVIE